MIFVKRTSSIQRIMQTFHSWDQISYSAKYRQCHEALWMKLRSLATNSWSSDVGLKNSFSLNSLLKKSVVDPVVVSVVGSGRCLSPCLASVYAATRSFLYFTRKLL